MTNLPLNPLISTLPVELVTQIIRAGWELPLSNDERRVLFYSFCLVNRAWLDIFIRIALDDVHIFSLDYLDSYLYLLRERNRGDSRDDNYQLVDARHTANRLCRSLTFRIEDNQTHTRSSSSTPSRGAPRSPAEVVTNLLEILDMLPSYLPNLRKITLEYVDCPWGFLDIFEQRRLEPFPKRVTHLEVKYLTAKGSQNGVDPTVMGHLRTLMSRRTLRSPRTLSVSGAPATVTSALMEMCPNIEELEIARPLGKLSRWEPNKLMGIGSRNERRALYRRNITARGGGGRQWDWDHGLPATAL